MEILYLLLIPFILAIGAVMLFKPKQYTRCRVCLKPFSKDERQYYVRMIGGGFCGKCRQELGQ